MAGRPVIRNQIDLLKAKGPEAAEYALEQFAGGKSVDSLCKHFGVGVRGFYGWIASVEGLKAAWEEAKVYRARSFADGAHEVPENLADPETGRMRTDVSSEEIALAKLRSETKRWMATVNNPAEFGKAAKQVTKIAHLHLTALQAVNAEDTERRMQALEPGQPEPLPAEDVEIIDQDLEDALA